MTTTVRHIAFPSTGNLPVFVAQDLGLFEAEGLAVEIEVTPSSMDLMRSLVDEDFDIASGAVDNYIAYQEGDGEIELDGTPDLAVFMGGTQVELSLVVRPEIASFEDLRGASLALDAINTGFAFALYRMMDNAGLTFDDYDRISVGATPHRLEAVKNGDHAGTLLIDPFTAMAKGAGLKVLESSLDTFAHYQGQAFATNRAWAADNGDTLVAYIRAYLKALDWVFDPANAERAAEILASRMTAMKPEAVKPALAKLMNVRTGLHPKAEIDREGMETVLDLRSRYAPSGKQLGDIDRYLDLSWYRAALDG